MQVLKFVRGYGSRAVRGRLWPCGVVMLILAQGSAAPSDPWQGINLPLYAFNDVFDGYFVRPVAVTYDNLVPSFAQRGVSNAYLQRREYLVADGEVYDEFDEF